MKLSELVSETDRVIVDPCRMLGSADHSDWSHVRNASQIDPYWTGRVHICMPNQSILVKDDETGLVTRQIMRDGHLGAVTEDC